MNKKLLLDNFSNNWEVVHFMRLAFAFLLLISLLITLANSEAVSSATSPTNPANCICKLSQLKLSESYITKLPCQPGNCPGYEGIYTYEEGPEYSWNIPEVIESESPLRIYLFDVEKKGSNAGYTLSLKNVGTFDIGDGSVTVSLPENPKLSISSQQPFNQSGNKVTWKIFKLRPGDSKDIQFSAVIETPPTNLTAEASGVGSDGLTYKSKWDSGVYEVKGEAQWVDTPEGPQITGD